MMKVINNTLIEFFNILHKQVFFNMLHNQKFFGYTSNDLFFNNF